MFFMSKQRKVESQLAEYRKSVALCLEKFQQAFDEYCSTGDRTKLRQNVMEVSKAESIADNLRRDVEVMMYSKALFPESRGDILGLLESLDKVPNQAENVSKMLLSHHITIPSELAAEILQLVRISCQAGTALLDSMSKLFDDFINATVAIGMVDELESEADQIEDALIEQLFAGDYSDFEKLLLRNLAKSIASVSDRAEDAADRIRIVVAKRRI